MTDKQPTPEDWQLLQSAIDDLRAAGQTLVGLALADKQGRITVIERRPCFAMPANETKH